MVGIDYTKPGAQAFINSWADEFASWGVDYVKLDGVGSFDIPDVKAWSDALRQTGRPTHLELSNSLNIADAGVWETYSNGWRTGGDIECYCSSTSYPLTDWSNVASRFDQVAAWARYGEPGAFNDYDSIEVGNGANDGLTYDERKTQMSLWALAASPFILGTDLTHLTAADSRCCATVRCWPSIRTPSTRHASATPRPPRCSPSTSPARATRSWACSISAAPASRSARARRRSAFPRAGRTSW
jgi:alpha-galactosidase